MPPSNGGPRHHRRARSRSDRASDRPRRAARPSAAGHPGQRVAQRGPGEVAAQPNRCRAPVPSPGSSRHRQPCAGRSPSAYVRRALPDDERAERRLGGSPRWDADGDLARRATAAGSPDCDAADRTACVGHPGLDDAPAPGATSGRRRPDQPCRPGPSGAAPPRAAERAAASRCWSKSRKATSGRVAHPVQHRLGADQHDRGRIAVGGPPPAPRSRSPRRRGAEQGGQLLASPGHPDPQRLQPSAPAGRAHRRPVGAAAPRQRSTACGHVLATAAPHRVQRASSPQRAQASSRARPVRLRTQRVTRPSPRSSRGADWATSRRRTARSRGSSRGGRPPRAGAQPARSPSARWRRRERLRRPGRPAGTGEASRHGAPSRRARSATTSHGRPGRGLLLPVGLVVARRGRRRRRRRAHGAQAAARVPTTTAPPGTAHPRPTARRRGTPADAAAPPDAPPRRGEREPRPSRPPWRGRPRGATPSTGQHEARSRSARTAAEADRRSAPRRRGRTAARAQPARSPDGPTTGSARRAGGAERSRTTGRRRRAQERGPGPGPPPRRPSARSTTSGGGPQPDRRARAGSTPERRGHDVLDHPAADPCARAAAPAPGCRRRPRRPARWAPGSRSPSAMPGVRRTVGRGGVTSRQTRATRPVALRARARAAGRRPAALLPGELLARRARSGRRPRSCGRSAGAGRGRG